MIRAELLNAFDVRKSCFDNPCPRNSDTDFKSPPPFFSIECFHPASISDGHLPTRLHLIFLTVPGVGALGRILRRRKLGLGSLSGSGAHSGGRTRA